MCMHEYYTVVILNTEFYYTTKIDVLVPSHNSILHTIIIQLINVTIIIIIILSCLLYKETTLRFLYASSCNSIVVATHTLLWLTTNVPDSVPRLYMLQHFFKSVN